MSQQRRTVCFVLPSLNGGGAERAAVQILNGLDAASWERSMFLFAREGPYLAELDPSIASSASAGDRVAVGSAGTRCGVHRARAARDRDGVSELLHRADARSAPAQTGARVVFNQQTPMSAFLDRRRLRWRPRLAPARCSPRRRALGYAAADLIVATSHGVADDLTSELRRRPEQIRVLPNPVDLDACARAATEPIDDGRLPRRRAA